MGYTHYFYQKRAFTDAEWIELCKRTQQIVSEHAGILAGSKGRYLPEINVFDGDTRLIAFNGILGDSYEALMIYQKDEPPRRVYPEGVFHFCKTARKPYDVAVVAVLKAARAVAPDSITLSSDGEGVFD